MSLKEPMAMKPSYCSSGNIALQCLLELACGFTL